MRDYPEAKVYLPQEDEAGAAQLQASVSVQYPNFLIRERFQTFVRGFMSETTIFGTHIERMGRKRTGIS
jgi:hypothetical protein